MADFSRFCSIGRAFGRLMKRERPRERGKRCHGSQSAPCQSRKSDPSAQTFEDAPDNREPEPQTAFFAA